MLAAIITSCIAPRAAASQAKLDVSMANPFLMADKKTTTYLKIGLTGFEMAKKSKRTPANIAIVIDRSGSMQGDKIRRAKEAALMAIERLDSRDIVSVVAYSDTVSVLVPATKASDKETIRQGIERLSAGGSTALFAGVSKGADEVRKFIDRNRVNRIILLSDGLANVGPQSPAALGELGASLGKEGIVVTTIGLGLGYNEDLMTQLARKSDGNHAFVENATDLARIFNYEFGDVLSVVAQEVTIRIDCARGIRPVRVLGREADISGRRVTASLNQLYSNQEKYVMLEVEIPAGRVNTMRDIASVSVSYANMETQTTDTLSSSVAVRFTKSEDKIASSVDRDVMEDAVLQIATERNKLAMALRDKGKVKEAEDALESNVAYLDKYAKALKSTKLKDYSTSNDDQKRNLRGAAYKASRKGMVEWQEANTSQRGW